MPILLETKATPPRPSSYFNKTGGFPVGLRDESWTRHFVSTRASVRFVHRAAPLFFLLTANTVRLIAPGDSTAETVILLSFLGFRIDCSASLFWGPWDNLQPLRPGGSAGWHRRNPIAHERPVFPPGGRKRVCIEPRIGPMGERGRGW